MELAKNYHKLGEQTDPVFQVSLNLKSSLKKIVYKAQKLYM